MLLTTSGAFMFFKTRKAVLLTVHMLVVFNMEEDKVSSISHWLSDQESDWWKQEPMKNVQLREIWISRQGVAGLWAIVGSVITAVFEIINTGL